MSARRFRREAAMRRMHSFFWMSIILSRSMTFTVTESGDMILMRMAGILNEVFGDHSCIGRMGGDEFAVFLRDIGDRRD